MNDELRTYIKINSRVYTVKNITRFRLNTVEELLEDGDVDIHPMQIYTSDPVINSKIFSCFIKYDLLIIVAYYNEDYHMYIQRKDETIYYNNFYTMDEIDKELESLTTTGRAIGEFMVLQ